MKSLVWLVRLPSSMNILVTGATGFIGNEVVLALRKHSLKLVSRKGITDSVHDSYEKDISGKTSFYNCLEGVETIVHTAARVHQLQDKKGEGGTDYYKVNREGTLNLARQAANSGVGHFVFLSSIKVNGENTAPGKAFSPFDKPAPTDHYARSKYEAETGLLEISKETGMNVSIIRPPLVYGPGVKANFAMLLRAVKMGLPLPVGSATNKRSLVSIWNLVDLIVTCIEQQALQTGVYLVSDGDDLSTPELIRLMYKALGKKPRLISVDPRVIKGITLIVGKQLVFERLYGSLQADISETRDMLDWSPPLTVYESLIRTVQHKP